jgi:glutathione S-transferase
MAGMSDTVRLHHCAQARSFRVLWLLHEIGLPHQVVHHSFFDKSLRDPAFLALSPVGRVPAIEVDGRVMFESGAILEYLVETRAPHLGRAVGAPDRPDWLEWLHFAETIGQHLANLTQHHIVLRDPAMQSPTVMRLEAKRLENALVAVATRAERAGGHVLGLFSAADIALGYGFEIARRFVRFDLLPEVAAYHAQLAARPAFQAALAADGPPQIYRAAFYPAPEA